MPNAPYPYEVNWQIGHRKLFLNNNLFLIEPFLITKCDCISNIVTFAFTVNVVAIIFIILKAEKYNIMQYRNQIN